MSESVAIVDRGRGPQLSNSRITVQDLIPYLQRQCTYEQIMEAMPILTVEDIQVVERYVWDNYDAVMEQDRRIRERAAARRPPPEEEAAQRQQRRQRLESARQMIPRQGQERNGDQAPR